MMLIFDVLVFLYGIYTVYSAIVMKRTGQLSSWFRASGQERPIRDIRGYIDYIYGRTIVMGVIAALFGVAGFVNDYIKAIPDIMKAMMMLFLTVVIWFYAIMSSAKRKFW